MPIISKFKDFFLDNSDNPDVEEVAKNWVKKSGNSFYTDFIYHYPSRVSFNSHLIDDYLFDKVEEEGLTDDEILDKYWSSEDELHLLQNQFDNFPGEKDWTEFFNHLVEAGW